MKRNTSLPYMALAVAACAAVAAADTVELNDGTVIEGKVVAKSKRSIMVQVPSGSYRELDPADVKQITEGPVRASAPSKPVAPARPAVSAKPATEASRKLAERLQSIMGYMEREQLQPWPAREAQTVIQGTEPGDAAWKAQDEKGVVSYLKERPSDPSKYAKVWARNTSSTRIVEHNASMGSYVDKTPPPTWGRMYWHAKINDWGASHPNYLAFMRNNDQAMAFLDTLSREAGAEKQMKASDLWYKLFNARAGAARKESEIQQDIASASEGLKAAALEIGKTVGLGDAVWRIYEMSIRAEEGITPDLTDAQRIEMARARQALCKEVIKALRGS